MNLGYLNSKLGHLAGDENRREQPGVGSVSRDEGGQGQQLNLSESQSVYSFYAARRFP